MLTALRVTKGSTVALVSPTFVAGDGETATDADSTPTVTVTRADGTALAAPSVSGGGDSDSGVYTATLTPGAHTSQLDRLDVVWTATVAGATQTYPLGLEVVGAPYATLAELRLEPDLADPAKFPGWLVREILDEITGYVEDEIVGHAFVPRYDLETFVGDGTRTRVLSRSAARALRSVTIGGVAQSLASGWTLDPAGVLTAPVTFTAGALCSVGYEHGEDWPPPKLRRAVIQTVRYELLRRRSGMPENAISTTANDATIRLSTADASKGRPTGYLWLDPVLEQLAPAGFA